MEIQDRKRTYVLPVSNKCERSCSFCDGLGFKSSTERQPLDLIRSLRKAEDSFHSHLLIPCNWNQIQNRTDNFSNIENSKLNLIFQIHWRDLEKFESLERASAGKDFSASILVDEFNSQTLEKISDFQSNKKSKLSLVLIPTEKNSPGMVFLKELADLFEGKYFFYFPLKTGLEDGFLSCSKVAKKIKAWKKQVSQLEIKFPEGLALYDSRRSPWLEIAGLYKPVFQTQALGKLQIQFSVVIPVFNQKKYLLNAIQNLILQNLDPRNFEIIVIDDGGDDDLFSSLKELQQDLTDKINFQYLYFPRVQAREMGDASFRAGACRNLGAKLASGEIISFLDADILVSPNYITNVIAELDSADIVQGPRYDLKAEISDKSLKHSEIQFPRDFTIEKNSYWVNFYTSAKDWNLKSNAWKFICTHSLSMKRRTFNELHGFSTNFAYYGFEDTDFGYRAQKNSYRFHLSSENVYHQFHQKTRSEFLSNYFVRSVLLSKTANVFFLNHLDLNIFDDLRGFMNTHFGLLNNLNFYFIKKPKTLFKWAADYF